MISLVLGAFGGSILWLLYYAVLKNWPESYVSLNSIAATRVRGQVIRYLLFRVTPVYLICVFVGVTANRLSSSPSLAIALTIALHLSLTNLRAIKRAVTNSNGYSRGATIVINLLICIIIVGVGVLANHTYDAMRGIVPPPEDFVSAIWTALFVVLVSTAASRYLNQDLSADDLLREAEKDVSQDLWREMRVIAETRDCDSTLVRAIVAAEALQRPRWVRVLERWKGKVFPRGTYGVAQEEAPKPISDLESIESLCDRLSGFYPKAQQLDDERVRAKIEQRSPDKNFSALALKLYRELDGSTHSYSPSLSIDGRHRVEVLSVRRAGQNILLKGTAVAHEGNLLVSAVPHSSSVPAWVTADLGAPKRGEWQVSVPLECRRVRITDSAVQLAESHLKEDEVTADVNLDYIPS